MTESMLAPDQAASGASERSTRGVLHTLHSGGRELFAFVFVVLQLALLVHLITRFNLETRAFQSVAYIAFVGFIVHHFLPDRWRLFFFLSLSLGITTFTLGLEQGQWLFHLSLTRAIPLFAIGLVLIGICHLPVRLAVKVSLLAFAGVILAWVRSNRGAWLDASLDDTWIWPVLGSMFMFRLMVYLYDLQHERAPVQPVRSLSYFFLLPNVCFPLFPVIDYKTFCRSYYNEACLQIYQRGLAWMTRGIIHLLLWRIVYYEFHVAPSRVTSGADLAGYLVSNMGLYLRVSGQFHLVIGLLLLFGFNLPETNRRYFLAASFTDYWRRVNIYWKDFIMKLFYYPAVFRLKAWGPVWSVVAGTGFAFFATWLLHSYQTFWVRNSFPIKSPDLIFWGGLCVLVIIGSVYEVKKGRMRTLGGTRVSFLGNMALGARTAGTFLVLSVLWSLWACDSLEQWLGLWEVANRDTLLWGAATLGVVFVAAVVVEGTWRRPSTLGPQSGRTTASPFPFRRALLTCALPAAVLLVISVQRFHVHLGPGAAAFLASLYETRPNEADAENMVRGYYEELQHVNPVLEWGSTRHPKRWELLERTDVFREVADFRMYELAPSSRTVLNNQAVSTNRWGMRDREYELAKPPGTYRITILGSSSVMGSNVSDGEPFEALVEERLNRERAGKPHARYEILNFAVNAYAPATQVVVLEKKALSFKPDAVVLVVLPEDANRNVNRFAKSLHKAIEPVDETLRQIARKAGVFAGMPEHRAERRLMAYWPQLMEWALTRVAAQCREAGITALALYMPGLIGNIVRQGDAERIIEMTRNAGFGLINLKEVYSNADQVRLRVAPWDGHPNAAGHRLVADALYSALIAEPGGLFSSNAADAQSPPQATQANGVGRLPPALPTRTQQAPN